MPGLYTIQLLGAKRHVLNDSTVSKRTICLLNCAFSWRDNPPPAAPVADVPAAGSSAASSSSSSSSSASTTTRKRKAAAADPLEGLPLGDQASMVAELENSDNGTVCHDLAKKLMRSLAAGRTLRTFVRPPIDSDAARALAKDQFFLRNATRFIASRNACCIRVQTTYHSFVLVRCGNFVESIEGWAGNKGSSFSLDECVEDPFPVCTLTDCLAALPLLLDRDDATRNAAFDRLSRAGRSRPYYTTDAVKTMEIEVCLLKPPAAFAQDVITLLERVVRWENLLRKNVRKINKFKEGQDALSFALS